MRVAFHAPLKAPDHPVPSGDRQLARLLMQAIASAGHTVSLASRLRSFDRDGDAQRQARLRRIGAKLAARLIERWPRDALPDVWFTYHLYHKAPDLIGPAASRALGIPYVVAEASIAPKERDGRWRQGYADALAAIRAADTIVFLNPRDEQQVRKARAPDAPAASLPPFVDAAAFTGNLGPADRLPQSAGPVRLATVAMMREGAKLASYRALAAALRRLRGESWELAIVGDGPARAQVAAAFADFGNRVRFLGARTAPDIAALLRESACFVWPAIDEAIGIAFLEAQACGVPVVGAATAGVAAVVDNGRTGFLVAPGDVGAFAAATRRLVADIDLRQSMGRNAFDYVRERHDITQAASRLDTVLHAAVAHRRALAESPC